jgi:outer membrane protein assembly factor BamB
VTFRIRTGASWRHDPHLLSALRRAQAPARGAAARAVVDALALEVDGIDIAAGRAEGALLPSLEALLRAVARVVLGASHAAVTFPEGETEVLIRRRGSSALLTVIALSRPSRVLARDVEVDLEALAAAALDAAAEFCRELAELLPQGGAPEARRLRAAARDLRRAEAVPAHRPRLPARERAPRTAARPGRVSCVLELADDEGVLGSYEGGRPDLGSLLVPGRVSLRGADGAEICTPPGFPFLALRDLGAATDALLAAIRRGDRTFEIPLARAGAARHGALRLDLEARTVEAPGRIAVACPPLELARAVAEAAAELGRVARARNPRQAENGHLAELEAGAADRLAQIEELAEGDRALPVGAVGLAPASRPLSQGALGPGRLRRLSFRRIFSVDAGAPAGDGLLVAGGVTVAAGLAGIFAVERTSGAALWRGDGCGFAAALPGALLLARESSVSAVAPRTGRLRWSRPLPGAAPISAVALVRGPYVLVEPGALTALDPGSGRTLWRFEPPGATRLVAAPFGGIVAVGADTGSLYGLDAAGRLAWRVQAPGPITHAPTAGAGACLALAAARAGITLLALEPSSGERRFEVALELSQSGPPLAWGPRLAVPGGVGGDAAVTVLERNGAPSFTAAPPLLAGSAHAAAAGPLLVLRDPRGALVALDREGAARWSRPALPDHDHPGSAAPAVARGTVVTPAGDGLVALDARTGEIVCAIPGAAPSRLAVDAALGVAAMDADGLASGWRLVTHLSVV